MRFGAGSAAALATLLAQVASTHAFVPTSSPGYPTTHSVARFVASPPEVGATSTSSAHADDDDSANLALPELFPSLSSAIASLGFSTPTPIQASSAERALSGENLLLIAPTGSGKTVAYFLPAVTKAMDEDGTVLVVAPTRELAVQLMRDAVSLLSGITDDPESCVRLAVKGVEMPTSSELGQATILIGTPPELYDTLTLVEGGNGFLAGDTLSAIVLDEVDVLLPPAPKHLRTALDSVNKEGGRARNVAQDERKKKEQKRKLLAAKRRGVKMDDGNRIISDTEKIIGLVASNRMMGEDETSPAQVLAGSATASRKALDRLNKALRSSANGASIPFDLTWSGDVKMCRPDVVDSVTSADSVSTFGEGDQHTIRAVTVPTEVEHRYIELSKEEASSPTQVLSAVAEAATKLKPETALIFLCGEFGKPNVKEKARQMSEIRGATSKARRNAMRKQRENAAKALYKQHKGGKKKASAEGPGLSARRACKMLSELGVDAQPLHVALGLELNAKEGDEREDTPPFLVTFEGSARGLHFDAVDAVFVVGRPSSAASYLHLAGRVGRSSADADGNVVVRPGTVVSVCTKGSAGELEKWTKQIGGTDLKEMIV